MEAKLEWRKIGEVNILELEGIFSDPWSANGGSRISQHLEAHPASGLLINLRAVQRLDQHAAELLLGVLRKASKGGILGYNLPSYYVAEHMVPNEPIPVFEKENQAIRYFGKELAQASVDQTAEKRMFPRIPVALPLEFEFRDEEEKKTYAFEAIALNLSEGGLCAEFLDFKNERLFDHVLDPFDLRMLSIRLSLGEPQWLRMKGKLLRLQKTSPSRRIVGLEFYNLSAADKKQIGLYLKANLPEMKKENENP